VGTVAPAIALVFALSIAGCNDATGPARARSAFPVCPDCNLVLISLDTLRADHVGTYGYDRPTTPAIDRLAQRSVVFERAISQSSWTRPAHMSIMTGLYPSEHGVLPLSGRHRLADGVPTLASVLRDNGYRTVAFTGGLNVAAVFGFDQGFDLYRANGRHVRDNLEEVRWWLDRNEATKFFLFLHGYEPHGPYIGDPMDRAAFDLDARPPQKSFPRICKRGGPRKAMRAFVDEYDAAIRRGDRYVGKFLAELEARGLMEKTVIVFTSDHGEEFLDHGGCFHLKALHRELLHVPLMITAPGAEPRRVKDLVPASISIAPTLLELAGIRDHGLGAASLTPALRGADVGVDAVVSETIRPPIDKRPRARLRALTTPRSKLVVEEPGPATFYDLIDDPLEQEPIADSPETERLRKKLDTWIEAHPAREGNVGETEIPDELARDLEALGYM